jgi:hypothetical protein
LFLRYADLVASLGGTYRTSSDMNTGEADMDVIGERTEYVFGRSVEAGGSGNPAPPTAVGVYRGIRASLAHVFGSDDLEGRNVVIQGAGGVGSPLAEHLANAGASLVVADIDPARAHVIAGRVGGTAIAADDVFETDCDVYAPCAVGGVLSAETVPRLRCRIVAGSANNQLAEPEAAELLRARGILYAPDYVINAGGAIALVGLEQLGWSKSDLDAALTRIGETLREIYERADERGISTAAAADVLAEERLKVANAGDGLRRAPRAKAASPEEREASSLAVSHSAVFLARRWRRRSLPSRAGRPSALASPSTPVVTFVEDVVGREREFAAGVSGVAGSAKLLTAACRGSRTSGPLCCLRWAPQGLHRLAGAPVGESS